MAGSVILIVFNQVGYLFFLLLKDSTWKKLAPNKWLYSSNYMNHWNKIFGNTKYLRGGNIYQQITMPV